MHTIRQSFVLAAASLVMSPLFAEDPPSAGTLPDSSDHAVLRTMLQKSRDAKVFPKDVVIRLEANAWMPSNPSNGLKESWEFSSNQVHRIVRDESKRHLSFRRVQSLPVDTKTLCRELLDAHVFEIEAAEGSGTPLLFAGTSFEGGVGDRSIEILVDGQLMFLICESCVGGAMPETNARAFSAVYQKLASRARGAFGVKNSVKPTTESPK